MWRSTGIKKNALDWADSLVCICNTAITDQTATNSNTASSGSRGWSFTTSRHSLEDLDNASHNHELKSPDVAQATHVHVDCCTMGVGGIDSWSPNVDPSYFINDTNANGSGGSKSIDMSVLLKPLYEEEEGREAYARYHRGELSEL